MVDVLRAVSAGEVGPTRIMYKSNLSWSVCKELLRHLCTKGFLTAKTDGGRRRYELTAIGLDVLGRFVRVAEEMGA
jgi:predicted transcriptional regulator